MERISGPILLIPSVLIGFFLLLGNTPVSISSPPTYVKSILPKDIPAERKTEGMTSQNLDVGGSRSLSSVSSSGPVDKGTESRGGLIPRPADIGGELMTQARERYKSGDYRGAAEFFQKVMRQQGVTADVFEEAVRSAADCYYQMGMDGSNQYLLMAVDYYRFILKNYPNYSKENERIYINLSKTYEALHFNHEAATHWRVLLDHYPSSPHYEEALFRIAENLYRIGRFEQASNRYRQYIEMFPTGAFMKDALLRLASSYFNSRDFEKSGQVFDILLAKLPDVYNVPKDVIYQVGITAYHRKKHADAVRFLSRYVSIYPGDGDVKSALYTMGCTFRDMGRFKTAIQVYSQVIDRFPQSPEAISSMLATAAIGVHHPGMRMPFYLSGTAFYSDPLAAFDAVLARSDLTGQLEEAILYAKGNTLLRNNRYLDAIKVYLEILKRFSRGTYASRTREELKAAVIKSVGESYERGDYLAVAALFYRTGSVAGLGARESETLFMVADSLHRLSLNAESRRIYEYLKVNCTDGQSLARLHTIMENINVQGRVAAVGDDATSSKAGSPRYRSTAEYELALQKAEGDERRWLLFEMGILLISEGYGEDARRVFARIKEGDIDSFWAKLSDYAIKESIWVEKFPSLATRKYHRMRYDTPSSR